MHYAVTTLAVKTDNYTWKGQRKTLLLRAFPFPLCLSNSPGEHLDYPMQIGSVKLTLEKPKENAHQHEWEYWFVVPVLHFRHLGTQMLELGLMCIWSDAA